MDSVLIVIPARYGSTRLHAKPLAEIQGKPMIQWVFERCKRARGVAEVVVATDHETVANSVRSFGGSVVMTSPDLLSGTDRVAAVAEKIHADIYVNVQGDEPLIDPGAIEKAVELVRDKGYSMGTAMTPLRHREELLDPSVVKVIADREGRAIYFSRLPIPYSRGPLPEKGQPFACRKHVGLYVFRRQTLLSFSKLTPSPLEKSEVLEQLRALEFGIPIGIAEVDFHSIGVDTPEDLEKLRRFLV